MYSPTELTLDRLRKAGWTAEVVERWVPAPHLTGGGFRRDFLGCIDIVAVRRGETLAVQCTSASGHSARVKKVCKEPRMYAWLSAGNRLEVWSWDQEAPRCRWRERVEEITADRLVAPEFHLEAG